MSLAVLLLAPALAPSVSTLFALVVATSSSVLFVSSLAITAGDLRVRYCGSMMILNIVIDMVCSYHPQDPYFGCGVQLD